MTLNKKVLLKLFITITNKQTKYCILREETGKLLETSMLTALFCLYTCRDCCGICYSFPVLSKFQDQWNRKKTLGFPHPAKPEDKRRLKMSHNKWKSR